MAAVPQIQTDHHSTSQSTQSHSGEHDDEPPFPINRLPEDVLKHIFEITRNTHPLPPSGNARKRTAAAFHLSHVCQHWRRVAQDDALLWTDIDTADMDLADCCLALCKDAPIRLVVKGLEQDKKNERAHEMLQRHLYHVQELRVHLHPYDLEPFLCALPHSKDWPRTAPMLTALVVNSFRYNPRANISEEFEELVTNMATFPIFIDPPSQLLDITFYNATPPASSPIWDGKRTLSLWWCSEPHRSMSDYFDLIARSPNLTSLTIAAEMWNGLRLPDSQSQFTASHLTKLTIVDFTPSEIISFLDHIILPEIRELTIHVVPFERNGEDASVDLLPSSQRSLDIFNEITTLTVGSRKYARECDYRYISPRKCATAWTGSCSDLQELFTVTVPPCYQGRLNVYPNTLSLFPNLHTVVIKHPYTKFAWDLGTSHTVRTLRIEDLYHGNRICVEVFEELERLKCLPCLNRIELVSISFLDEGFDKVLSAVEALLSHSMHEPTFIMSSCGYFSQREQDAYLRSLGFQKYPQISKVTKWEKFKGMTQRPLSSIREVWRR
ncbi:hypothetical protein K439DRAFT_1663806 [Ramaria rubella]|nr:hypothetical protein K439DRAFT_1663806 [Ramaria rubella]